MSLVGRAKSLVGRARGLSARLDKRGTKRQRAPHPQDTNILLGNPDLSLPSRLYPEGYSGWVRTARPPKERNAIEHASKGKRHLLKESGVAT